jgi:hypothetical protein
VLGAPAGARACANLLSEHEVQPELRKEQFQRGEEAVRWTGRTALGGLMLVAGAWLSTQALGSITRRLARRRRSPAVTGIAARARGARMPKARAAATLVAVSIASLAWPAAAEACGNGMVGFEQGPSALTLALVAAIPVLGALWGAVRARRRGATAVAAAYAGLALTVAVDVGTFMLGIGWPLGLTVVIVGPLLLLLVAVEAVARMLKLVVKPSRAPRASRARPVTVASQPETHARERAA